MPLVSIIVPVYNVEKYLEKCLRSIIDQSFNDFEIIIVNDGSTDCSMDIIDSYQKRYPAIIKSIYQVNKGVSAARNAGMKMASGGYLMFIDSDDYIGKDFVNIMVSTAEEGNFDMVYAKGHTKVYGTKSDFEETIYNENRFLFRVRSVWAHLYKRELINNYSIIFPEKCNYEDNYFNLAVESITDKCQEADTCAYFYLQRSNSLRFVEFKNIDDSRFPHKEFTALFEQIKNVEGERFYIYEFSIIRFFTAVIFSNGRKSDRKVIGRMCNYFVESLKTYFPKYYKNKYLNPFRYKEVPLPERFGIWLFAQLIRFNFLKPFAIIYTRF